MRKRRRQVSKVLSELQTTLNRVVENGAEPNFKRDESLRLLTEFAKFQTAIVSEDVVSDPEKKVQEVKRAIHRSSISRSTSRPLASSGYSVTRPRWRKASGRRTNQNSSSKRSLPIVPAGCQRMS